VSCPTRRCMNEDPSRGTPLHKSVSSGENLTECTHSQAGKYSSKLWEYRYHHTLSRPYTPDNSRVESCAHPHRRHTQTKDLTCISSQSRSGINYTSYTYLNLLYLSTSLLWWHAVADMIGVTSSPTLRKNARCTWRHSEGARNVSNTAIRRAFSPLRPGGRVPADVHGSPRGVAPLRHPLASRDTPGGAHGRRNDPIASPCHGRRCPPVSLLFASGPWLLHTGCSLQPIDMTVQ